MRALAVSEPNRYCVGYAIAALSLAKNARWQNIPVVGPWRMLAERS